MIRNDNALKTRMCNSQKKNEKQEKGLQNRS